MVKQRYSLDDLLLKALIPVIIRSAEVNGEIKNSEFKAENRKKLVDTIKGFTMRPSSLRDLNEAIVTAGGVSTKEINPKTMESKLLKGLGSIFHKNANRIYYHIYVLLLMFFLKSPRLQDTESPSC